MYGGYRDVKKCEESSNPPVPSSASKAQSTRNPHFRGLSGLTTVPAQPVRTKFLLDELREVYDDIDNSASKKPIKPPEDDPLIWSSNHSLPKGMEWMIPTPSKIKTSSANTIPETVGSLLIRDVNHSKAGLLATDEGRSSSSLSLSDTPSVSSNESMKNGNFLSEAELPARAQVINDVDKENVFTPYKLNRLHGDSHRPIQHELLSSSKKNFPLDSKIHNINHLPVHNTVEKEVLFTPLKRNTSNTAPFADLNFPAPVTSVPAVADHVPLSLKISSLEPSQTEPKKSPTLLCMQPHTTLQTPMTSRIAPSSGIERPAAENPSSLKADKLGSWNTPAKLNGPLDLRDQHEVKSGVSLQHAILEGKIATVEESCKKFKSNNLVQPVRSSLFRKADKAPHFEEKDLLSKMTLLSNSVEKAPVNPCTPILKSLPNPVMISTPRPVQKISIERLPPSQDILKPPVKEANSSSEMPPPSRDILKPPVKEGTGSTEMPPPSRDILKPPVKEGNGSTEMPPPSGDILKPPAREGKECVNNPAGLNATEKRNINDQIYVNGKPYTVLSLLGKGGSSVVYQVLEPATSKMLAIKCVNLSELDLSTYEGYLNEIKLLAQFQGSDCVIRMLDHQHCKDEKTLYVVMEKGETDLSKLIRDVTRTKKVSPAMTVYYWTEMLNAVSFIHQRGTIHSDLKPANFLLVSGRLKLIDFGIASAIQADMTSVVKDTMTGTYNYISPEALCSTGVGPDGSSMRFKISFKSDVWSLGCILYNLVYGHTPFQKITNQFMKMTAIANPNHKIVFPPAPGFPTALLQAMQACLQRNPKLRPSVEDLLQYQYLAPVRSNTDDSLPRLFDEISAVLQSSDSSDIKVNHIRTLLSSRKTC